jgi:hypothetical protein
MRLSFIAGMCSLLFAVGAGIVIFFSHFLRFIHVSSLSRSCEDGSDTVHQYIVT